MQKKRTFWKQISAMKLIMYGFMLLIAIGSVLLSLPISTRDGSCTPFSDCVFTATSATCVTGLIRYDTFTHWSYFGQAVLLVLIQIGGLGFMTIALLVMTLTGRRIGLFERSLMQDSISAPELGGIVGMALFIVKGTFLIEGAGALLLMAYYIPHYGPIGIYFSVFHAISAFCNAGFDVMGEISGQCSSMVSVEGNVYVNLVLMALIVLGGLGFFVWRDLLDNRFRLRKLTLMSKLVLSVSGTLIVLGAVLLFLTEYNSAMFAGYTLGGKILSSFFQSVSARTAGFNTADLSKMSESGLLVMCCLMLVGGSSGSTAGGMKTTTLWVLFASVYSTIRREKNLEAFGRRLDSEVTRTASCIFVYYLSAIIAATIAITSIEQLPLITVLFETTSALATVGLTVGITGSLCMTSKWIIAVMMLCGRLGSITALLALSPERKKDPSRFPLDKIQLG